MKVSITKEIQGKYDALIIPFMRDTALKTSLSGLDPVASDAIRSALQNEKLKAVYGSQYSMNLFVGEKFLKIIICCVTRS